MKKQRVLRLLLVILLVTGLVVLAAYFTIFNLTTKPVKLDLFTRLPDVGGIESLLVKERIHLYMPFAREAFMHTLHSTDKVFHGEVVYVFDPSDEYFNKPHTRPFQYASFSRMKVNGEEWAIVGVRVLNKDRTVSFLHYGFSYVDFNNPEVIQKWAMQFNDARKLLVPLISSEDCSLDKYKAPVCKNMDKETTSLLLDWIKTGIVPKKLQTKILVPKISFWSPINY